MDKHHGTTEPLMPSMDSSAFRGAGHKSAAVRRTMSEQLADFEAEEKAHLEGSRDVKGFALAMMVYSAVGVIFGDLGTSVMYLYPSTFYSPPSKEDAMGALSLIIWTLTLLALVKYVLIVLWANDNGEGGTISLYSLLCREAKIGFEYRTHRSDRTLVRRSANPNGLARRSIFVSPSNKFKSVLEHSSALKRLLYIIVTLGTSAVIADGILTPGVSVLSAVEGLRVAFPEMPQSVVVTLTVLILLTIFSAQKFGTEKVGAAFAPILLLWLIGIAGVGVYNLFVHHIGVVTAFSPHHAIIFFIRNKYDGWAMLGGILLCVTGTEAMFADLGHFNVRAIQISFSGIAFPCLILQYLGQTAYLISHPTAFTSCFWSSIPQLVFWPMFVIGTLAAIVASQALITGVFSIANQLMSLNCLPPLKIVHTSTAHFGQIFVPVINYFLMTMTIAIVLLFQSSTNLSSAYGVAVTLDMLTTTFLVTMVMIMVWHLPIYLAGAFFLFFGTIEMAFFSSTMLKIPNGGWFPLVIAFSLTCIQYIWNWGQRLKSVSTAEQHIATDAFFAEGENELRLLWSDTPIQRVPGIAFFFSTANPGLPPVLQHFVRNVPALHDVLVLASIRHVPITTVLPEERILVEPLQGFHGVYRAVVRFGYNDLTDLGDGFAQEISASILRLCEGEGEDVQNIKESMDQSSTSEEHVIQINRDQQLSSPVGHNVTFAEPRLGHKSAHASLQGGSLSRNSVAASLVRNTVLATLQSQEGGEEEWKPLSLARHSQPAAMFRHSMEGFFNKGSQPGLNRASMPGGSLQSPYERHRPWTAMESESYQNHRRHNWSQSLEDVAISSLRPSLSPEDEIPQAEPVSSSHNSQELPLEAEYANRVQHARMQGAVYVVGRSNVQCRQDATWLRRFLLDKVYAVLHNNFNAWATSMNIPQDRLMEVGISVDI